MTESCRDSQTPPGVSFALPVNKPIATWVLLGIIIAVFVLETLSGGSTDTEVLVRMGAKVTPLIAAGEYWRLFTSMFLHIGVMHLFFNGYALFVLGTELERLLGWQRFLAIYLLSGPVWQPGQLRLQPTACQPARPEPSLASSAPWRPFLPSTASNWAPGGRGG